MTHPAIRFQRLPAVHGPIFDLNQARAEILESAIQRAKKDFPASGLERVLAEAHYLERLRLKRGTGTFFNRSRYKNDARLWSGVHQDFLKAQGEIEQEELLTRIIGHYAEEIGGHFDPLVYRVSTRAVPWAFNWLLNAASVKRFLPWKMTQSLQSSLFIDGEIEKVQALSKKGSLLLVPTHQSNIDSLLIGFVIYLMGLPPFAYGAGLNLFKNPLLSFFMNRLGAYTVDRGKKNLIYKTILKSYSTELLKRGIHSVFFPGGGRSRSGALESQLKLGLLGTGLNAQLEAMQAGNSQFRVFVVPMVMSYHFVLEASSLIEDYLEEVGKYRFLPLDDESWQPWKMVSFFWKLFATQSAISVRIGSPLDVFGNPVDETGRSIGPNGTVIDPSRWLSSRGEVRPDAQRDHEYTRELGYQLTIRYHQENNVLTSHLVAFSYFEVLRSQYPEMDLFRLLRLSFSQRRVLRNVFLKRVEGDWLKLQALERAKRLYLSQEFRSAPFEVWVEQGIQHLGALHEASVIRVHQDTVYTEDMNLLYYYRNRLAGYGLSRLAGGLNAFDPLASQYDSQGFLV